MPVGSGCLLADLGRFEERIFSSGGFQNEILCMTAKHGPKRQATFFKLQAGSSLQLLVTHHAGLAF